MDSHLPRSDRAYSQEEQATPWVPWHAETRAETYVYVTITILSEHSRPGQEVHFTFSYSPWRTPPRLLPNPDSRRRVAVFDPN